ncbi:MAG: ankyrin repeat domain-containing protein [Acidobacteria bacterium]|nr:ankyrin repeat domain-containing protein [Acidobacteriota bacterium]
MKTRRPGRRTGVLGETSVFLLLLFAAACSPSAPPSTSANDSGTAGEHEAATPDAPLIEGDFQVVSWEEVYAAGDLEWAWAIASDHGDLEKIEVLLGRGFDPDTPIGNEEYKRPALVEAAWHGYEAVLDRLLAAGADPMGREWFSENVPFYEPGKGDTALHKAAAHGRASIVRKLLAAGVPVDVVGIQDRTPLASAAGDFETFRVLLEAGADVERAGGLDRLFDAAVGSDSLETASFLLSRGASIEGEEAKRDYGYTPLWTATTLGSYEMVLFLLERGADPSIRPGGKPLADLARESGHEEVAELLGRALAGKPLRPAVESAS